MKIPCSIAIGDHDAVVKGKLRGLWRGFEQWEKEEEDWKAREVVIYEGASHGFAFRRLPEDKV